MSSCCALTPEQCMTILDVSDAALRPSAINDETVLRWKQQLRRMHPVMLTCLAARLRKDFPQMFEALAKDAGMPGDLLNAAVAFSNY